jgi:glycerophosphoryl diester phosphodiesterase
MPAFEYAIGLGYRYVETDVQVTADGVLVAFHDNDLTRTCNRRGKISELPWTEVQTALVDGVAPIPLLEDLLGTWPELRVNIDCKSDAAAPALVAALRRTQSIDRVCVGAFSDRRIRGLRSVLGSGLCSALGPAGVAALRFGRPRSMGGLTAQVPVKQGRLTVTDQRFIERAHALGIHVHVWTIDDAAEIDRLLDLGVDGIMTDRPMVLREVYERRGLWRA